MNRNELLELQKELTVLRNIVPAALDRVERLLRQEAPARPAKQKKISREAAILARVLTGRRKPLSTK